MILITFATVSPSYTWFAVKETDLGTSEAWWNQGGSVIAENKLYCENLEAFRGIFQSGLEKER